MAAVTRLRIPLPLSGRIQRENRSASRLRPAISTYGGRIQRRIRSDGRLQRAIQTRVVGFSAQIVLMVECSALSSPLGGQIQRGSRSGVAFNADLRPPVVGFSASFASEGLTKRTPLSL